MRIVLRLQRLDSAALLPQTVVVGEGHWRVFADGRHTRAVHLLLALLIVVAAATDAAAQQRLHVVHRVAVVGLLPLLGLGLLLLLVIVRVVRDAGLELGALRLGEFERLRDGHPLHLAVAALERRAARRCALRLGHRLSILL